MMLQPIAGIPLGAWQRFIKIFSNGISEVVIQNKLKVIASAFAEAGEASGEQSASFDAFSNAFESLVKSLSSPG